MQHILHCIPDSVLQCIRDVHKVLLLAFELFVAVLQQSMQLIEDALWHAHNLLVLLCYPPL